MPITEDGEDYELSTDEASTLMVRMPKVFKMCAHDKVCEGWQRYYWISFIENLTWKELSELLKTEPEVND